MLARADLHGEPLMRTFLSIYLAAMAVYTAYCCAHGPPYRDAYGAIVHAAWVMATR